MCYYLYKGKTYTVNEFQEFVKNTKDSEFDSDELKSIAEGIIPDSVKSISEKSYNRLIDTVNKQSDALRKRLVDFESATEKKGYVPKEETINRIYLLQNKLNTLENVSKFFEIAKYVDNELSIIHNFLEGSLDGRTKATFDFSNEDHIKALLEVEKQMETYKNLASSIPEFAELDPTIKNTAKRIDILYKNINESINEKQHIFAENFIKTRSKQDLTEQDIKLLLSESKDIESQEFYLSGMSNSMDKTLQLLQKEVEEKREEIYDNSNKKEETIQDYDKKLKAAGITDFEWALQRDIDGKLNGKYIAEINNKYYKDRQKLFDALKDSEGNKKQYIVKPLDKMSKEEIAYNLQLAKDKKAFGDFSKAETIDDNNDFKDGENHKYNDEFKAKRDFFEEFKYKPNEGLRWVEKPFVEGSKIIINGKQEDLTLEQYNKELTLYKRKYYTEPKLTYILKSTYDKTTNTYVKNGDVIQVEVSYVKPDYVEIITMKNGKPTQYAEKKYYDLMNDNTKEGKARKEYFDFFKKTINEELSELPLDTQKSMKNELFRIQGNLSKDMSSKGFGFFNLVNKSIRKFVNPDVIFSTKKTDESGDIVEDIPIIFVGDLKSNKKLNTLKSKLEILSEELRKNPTNNEITKSIAKVKNSILIEENKLTPDELELDLTKQMIAVVGMSENYKIMKRLEPTLLIFKNIIKNKKFYKIDKAGNKNYINTTSLVQKRLEAYLRMIFYSNSTKNDSKIMKMIQNYNQYGAIKALGLNPFSAVNNYIMANINNRIEAFGKQFGFNNRHLNEAKLETNKYLASFTYLNRFKKDNYLDNKPSNKYEAMLKHFNWIDRDNTDTNKGNSFINDFLFIGLTAGEFIAQSNTAIAKLKSIELTNNNGDKVSIWDAFDFKDGKLEIKDGYTLDLATKRKLSVDIKNMNKIIHGNYSSNDKAALQESALGQMAFQFKKWMFNFAKNRFGNTYFDETSGDYQEGRYRTLVNVLGFIKAGGARDFQSIKHLLTNLNDYQKSNLKKLQVESIYWMSSILLYYIFDAIAEGIDDDDEELKMMVNFLKKQSDRVSGELDAMINPKSLFSSIKNPVAGAKTIKELGDVIVQSARTPFLYSLSKEQENYYKKGPNKGDLKLWKEIRDVTPIINQSAQFDALLNSGNYYFR